MSFRNTAMPRLTSVHTIAAISFSFLPQSLVHKATKHVQQVATASSSIGGGQQCHYASRHDWHRHCRHDLRLVSFRRSRRGTPTFDSRRSCWREWRAFARYEFLNPESLQSDRSVGDSSRDRTSRRTPSNRPLGHTRIYIILTNETRCAQEWTRRTR